MAVVRSAAAMTSSSVKTTAVSLHGLRVSEQNYEHTCGPPSQIIQVEHSDTRHQVYICHIVQSLVVKIETGVSTFCRST